MSKSQATGHSDELDSLLRKLRPFQREAFDFATNAKSPTTTNNNSAKSSGRKGCTTGRILIADEMVCARSKKMQHLLYELASDHIYELATT